MAFPYGAPGGYPYGQTPSGYPYPYPTAGPPPPYAAYPPPVQTYYFIRCRLNGLVLDVEGGNRQPGVRVITWQQKSSDFDNQLWYDDPSTGTIRSKLNDFALDLDGDAIVLKPYFPSNLNQQWERAEPFIRNRVSPQKVLDIVGGNTNAGARLTAWEKHGGLNQCFEFHYIAPQSMWHDAAKSAAQAQPPRRQFYIVSEMNCKVLDIRGDSPVSGASVIMWPNKKNRSPNQLWYFDDQGVIRSALNNFALEASVDGAKVKMMPFTGSPHQRWTLVGNKIMKNQYECLDICGANKKDGAEVISFRYKGSANQHWRLEYV